MQVNSGSKEGMNHSKKAVEKSLKLLGWTPLFLNTHDI
jgi:hypothetical protein